MFVKKQIEIETVHAQAIDECIVPGAVSYPENGSRDVEIRGNPFREIPN